MVLSDTLSAAGPAHASTGAEAIASLRQLYDVTLHRLSDTTRAYLNVVGIYKALDKHHGNEHAQDCPHHFPSNRPPSVRLHGFR